MDGLFSDDELDQSKLEEQKKARSAEPAPAARKKEDDREFNKRLFIVDGYSLIYRSYFAFLTRPLTDGEGKNVSAYFGFFNTVFMLLREYQFDYFIIALDAHAPTFRHEMYPEYKANRDAAPDDLHEQVPRIVETLKKMNIPYISREGFEADDLIATLCVNATRLGVESVMVTGDKDLLQLVNEHVKALRPPKKGQPKYELFGQAEVKEAYQVMPSQIVDYLSLIGDTADNVPGVKGIGEKGAAKLLEEYVSLDGIYRHLDSLPKGSRGKLEAGKDSAYLSRELIKLKSDVFTVESFDTPLFAINTIDYAAGVEEFVKAACNSLARTALSFSHGDKGSIMKAAEENVKSDGNNETRAPEEYLGAGAYLPVETLNALRGFLEDAVRQGGVIAFDTETTDIDIAKAELAGFSFSYELKKGCYFPLIAGGVRLHETAEVVAVLKEYFAEGRLAIVGQNVKYDLAMLDKLGICNVKIAFDTMLAAWLIDSNAGVYNLDELASRYLSYDTLKYEEVVPKGKDFTAVSAEDAVRYSGEDSDLAWRLYKYFSSLLDKRGLTHLLSDYELPLIPVLMRMEKYGVLLDRSFMENLQSRFASRHGKLAEDIYALAGHEFNLNSSQQLAKVLFEERGLEAVRKTQRGYSTDTATLEALRSTGDPIIGMILEYRGVAKLLSTYIETLPLLCDEEDRIHTSYLQTGTATGRLSSRNPNLQNIPIRSEDGRLIRSAFIPASGCRFLSADYSQIELVVLAHVSGDKELCKAFLAGEDVHRYTASLIFEKKPEDVTPDERRIAKTINFGIMYGMSPFRLSNELSISRSDAKSFIDKYFERYSGIKSFVDETVRKAEAEGAVHTMGGHVRTISGINSRNKNEKQAAERVAVNTIIQGTAAEIMKKAMIRIDMEIQKRKLKSRLLLQVHDELIFEVPAAELDEMKSLVRELMENAVKLSVPVRASLEDGARWGDMH